MTDATLDPADIARLRAIDLFADAPEPALRGLAAEASLVRVASGAVVFQQMAPADSVFAVLDGGCKAIFSPRPAAKCCCARYPLQPSAARCR
jgi:hypothetical protein